MNKGPSTQYARLSCDWSNGVELRRGRVEPIPVPAPLPHVAVHVVESPGIWQFSTDGVRLPIRIDVKPCMLA